MKLTKENFDYLMNQRTSSLEKIGDLMEVSEKWHGMYMLKSKECLRLRKIITKLNNSLGFLKELIPELDRLSLGEKEALKKAVKEVLL